MVNVSILLPVLILTKTICSYENGNKFPKDFLFGTGTSAYQIEGAWNTDGKGESVWDRFTHQHPEKILDGSNADVACDSYHRLEEDVSLMKHLGIQFYRFSLSWTRILPTGFANKVNPKGIQYYNRLIDLLIQNNITPMVTLFHWDTPVILEDLGGFTNSLMENWFRDYAKVAFEHFGDRVKLWLTINEPSVMCTLGYGGTDFPPSHNLSGFADYLCMHNAIKAHAKAYRLYNQYFRKKQNGKISIVLPSYWFEPASAKTEDADAAQRMLDFNFGWYADPILHPKGDYPQSMKVRIAKRSKLEGYPNSRLPEFTKAQINYIKGTFDYIALNHYTTQMVANKEEELMSEPSFEKDLRALAYYEPYWPESSSTWIKLVPWGLRKILNYIKNRYGDHEIYITENGFSNYGEIKDYDKINYLKRYLCVLLDSIVKDNVQVKGYAVWSLLDNFEWFNGYAYRFGIYHVDFAKPSLPRKKRLSAEFYKKFINGSIMCSKDLTCDLNYDYVL